MITTEQLNFIRQQLVKLKVSGALNGEDADKSENLHRLFMYPAMMVPAAQYAVIQAISSCLPQGINAIDPFMGSGTSLMSCLEFGYNVFGQDINPFAVLLTKAKVEKYDITQLKSICSKVLQQITNDKEETVDVSFNNIDKWFNHDIQINLSKIRRAIQSVGSQAYRYFLWVIMAEVIRTGSNDRTSTFKLHCRSKEDIQKRKVDVIKEFGVLLNRGVADIENYWAKLDAECAERGAVYSSSAIIRCGNSKDELLTNSKFDLLVSSPPYGDNHTTVTYGQTSYLPLQWIDSVDLNCPFDYIKTTQEIDRQSLGGRLDKKEMLRKANVLISKSPAFKRFFEGIPDNEKVKYNKTIAFISDFDQSLDNIVGVMNEDAFYIWTIGNRYVRGREVPNDMVLIDLMRGRGISLFERAERQILNKKQARKNNYSKTMEKEHILVFHKNPVL